eukprot:CAMPEP_0115064914 /NCGR_PEP_ID=MMETSP0227-20121206/9958_1 /TAXON_ID=89957 /ORGANISM="Polarella glacialis, Strain CCMP 1383" /LENGTH=67 /DNA_ID=CAMNT_0002450641 /DNA_START=369 /DNA_END=569 /DNA_ORIENTATION=-
MTPLFAEHHVAHPSEWRSLVPIILCSRSPLMSDGVITIAVSIKLERDEAATPSRRPHGALKALEALP